MSYKLGWKVLIVKVEELQCPNIDEVVIIGEVSGKCFFILYIESVHIETSIKFKLYLKKMF